MKRSVWMAGLLSVMIILGGALAQAAGDSVLLGGRKVKPARYPVVYVGGGNITVEVARYSSGTAYQKGYVEGAILLFKGVEGEWDGKAVAHQLTNNEALGRQTYSTDWKGKRFETLLVNKDNVIELFLPGQSASIRLAPSDGAAKMTSVESIFKTYEAQKAGK